jgi:hypothetical protein
MFAFNLPISERRCRAVFVHVPVLRRLRLPG